MITYEPQSIERFSVLNPELYCPRNQHSISNESGYSSESVFDFPDCDEIINSSSIINQGKCCSPSENMRTALKRVKANCDRSLSDSPQICVSGLFEAFKTLKTYFIFSILCRNKEDLKLVLKIISYHKNNCNFLFHCDLEAGLVKWNQISCLSNLFPSGILLISSIIWSGSLYIN